MYEPEGGSYFYFYNNILSLTVFDLVELLFNPVGFVSYIYFSINKYWSTNPSICRSENSINNFITKGETITTITIS